MVPFHQQMVEKNINRAEWPKRNIFIMGVIMFQLTWQYAYSGTA